MSYTTIGRHESGSNRTTSYRRMTGRAARAVPHDRKPFCIRLAFPDSADCLEAESIATKRANVGNNGDQWSRRGRTVAQHSFPYRFEPYLFLMPAVLSIGNLRCYLMIGPQPAL